MAHWLLRLGGPPPGDVLRAANLAAYAYTVLPAEHALRPSVRGDFLRSLRRHCEIKQEMLTLVRAWRAAGLDVLLFKGFQLAEFVYPVPGSRFHGDVDVLIRPEHLTRAAEVARLLGWHEVRPAPFGAFTHCAFTLARTGGATMVDVHRWVVHGRLPWSRVQRRITEAVWNDSRIRLWDEVEVREPNPVDMLLAGLVLQRCWGSDQWHLKPSDLVDFQYVASRCGIDREALWARARALQCERTLSLFLERCDPGAQRFDLSRPTHAQRRCWNRAAFRERGLLGVPERRLAQILNAPARVWVGAAFVPTLLRVRRTLRSDSDMHKLLRALTPLTDRVAQARPDEPRHVTAGVRWAMRLVGNGPHSVCVVRSLAIYSLLRRRGWPVEFVSGVRRDGTSVVGHAWVEHEGSVLWELREPANRALYRESFRFPR